MSSFSQSIPRGKVVLTYDDYCLLPHDRNRYEILDGELSVTPAPSTKHQRISSQLHRILANHIEANQLGSIYAALTDLILAPVTVVQPDLIFIGNDRRHIVTERAIEGAPNLLIEILPRQLIARTASPRPSYTPNIRFRTTGLWIPISGLSKPTNWLSITMI